MKKLPDLRKLFLNNTSRQRQTWRQQLMIMTEWARRVNEYHAAKTLEQADGR
jgi:hypothetical protein